MSDNHRLPPLLFVAALLLIVGTARAHERTTSFSTWEIRGAQAKVTARIALLDASRFPWFAAPDRDRRLQEYVVDRLTLQADGAACVANAPPQRLEAPAERLVFEWSVTCPTAGALALHSELFFDIAPAHLHFARVSVDGSPRGEHVFSEAQRTWTLSDAPDAAHALGTSFTEYVMLGIGHILTGYDHLAFLLVLLLIERRILAAAKIVTGFTIGHSITLALATLGMVHPARGAVEALIGLSIAVVAVENLWLMARQPAFLPWALGLCLLALAGAAQLHHGMVPALTLGGLALFVLCYFHLARRTSRPWRLRWAVAFLFGLIHGFGFASVLVEAELPAPRLVQALAGFNLGVETGQIAVVILAWPVALALARMISTPMRTLALEATSAVVLALGTFWYVLRAYG